MKTKVEIFKLYNKLHTNNTLQYQTNNRNLGILKYVNVRAKNRKRLGVKVLHWSWQVYRRSDVAPQKKRAKNNPGIFEQL